MMCGRMVLQQSVEVAQRILVPTMVCKVRWGKQQIAGRLLSLRLHRWVRSCRQSASLTSAGMRRSITPISRWSCSTFVLGSLTRFALLTC